MTICEKCRKELLIATGQFDLGEGLEELELEACPRCRILYVANATETWTIKLG